MEKNSQKLIDLANKSYGDILSSGFKLFFQTYGTLIIPLAVFQIVLIVLNVLLLTDLTWSIDSMGIAVDEVLDKFIENESLTESELNILAGFLLMTLALLFLQNLIGAIVIAIAMCSVSNYTFKRYMGEKISFIKSLKTSFNKRIFIVVLFLGILLPISFLLFIPAIIIFGFFIFLVFTFNIEDVEKPIAEARAIAKGGFWKIIGVFLINVIVIFIISYFYNSLTSIIFNTNSTSFMIKLSMWSSPAYRNYGMLILYQIINSTIDIIFAPLFICLLTSLFSSLRARRILKTGYYQEYYPKREIYQESFNISENKESSAISEIKLEGGFYCPYCGVLIKSPKKFCPKCGETLSFIQD
ncbi:MAG: zinc ribbon domain-containing protein [Promethearchaeota archaeon]